MTSKKQKGDTCGYQKADAAKTSQTNPK